MSSPSTPVLRRTLALAAAASVLLAASARSAPIPPLVSPNGRIEVRVRAAERLSFDVLLSGRPLLLDSTLSLRVDGTTLGLVPRVRAARAERVDRIVEPPVHQKAASLRERYNQLRLEFEGGYAVVFRAFDEGVAYRFETSLPKPEVKVDGEEASFRFAGDWSVYYPQEESFFSHNERHYLRRRLEGARAGRAREHCRRWWTPTESKIAIAEVRHRGLPRPLAARHGRPRRCRPRFPPYPLEEKLERDRDFKVAEAADYIAVTSGTRSYPWRVLGIAEQDGDLMTNTLVYLLATPSRDRGHLVDQAGQGRLGLVERPQPPRRRLQVRRQHRDLQVLHRLRRALRHRVHHPRRGLVQARRPAHGRARDRHGEPRRLRAAEERRASSCGWSGRRSTTSSSRPWTQFERWGVKGLKVDFMQRDDQKLMAFYDRVCREAAKRKMLVDFHGAIRPAQLTRTWPNLITSEGVRGLEQLKWSDAPTPSTT